MVTSNHDDEIIEDYEEEAPQAAGGPVQPQAGRSAASEAGAAAAAKGKISHKQARMIWAVCIAVCVLGAGAVGVHYFFFGASGGTGAANTPRQPANQPKMPKKQLSEHEVNVQAYWGHVRTETMNIKRGSKAWDFFRVAQLRFESATRAAQAAKGGEDQAALDEAWLVAIKAYLHARYARELLRHVMKPKDLELPEDFHLPGEGELELLKDFSDELLTNRALARMHAAALLLDQYSGRINRFRADVINFDATCNRVWELRKADYAAEDGRLMRALEIPPQFEPADLEFTRSKDYELDEVTEEQKFLETQNG